MENLFLCVLRRLICSASHVEPPPAVDAAKIPDFLRSRVSTDGFRQAYYRFNDLERGTRQATVQPLHHAGNNAICYLTADGAVFGPIHSGFRVRTRKHGQPQQADNMTGADKVG